MQQRATARIDQFVNVGPLRLRYWDSGGATDSTPILLLHGITCSVLEWLPNIDPLAANGQRVLALDFPGHGLSDKPLDFDYTMTDIARLVFDFLAALGIRRAHLVGNSMGGRVALECALLEPERVGSISLLAPAGIGRKCLIDFRIATLPGLGELLTRPSHAGLKMVWRTAVHDKTLITDDFIRTKLALAREPGAQRVFLNIIRRWIDLGGFKPAPVAELHQRLAALRLPCLVLWGKQDKLLPVAHAELLRNAIPHAQVHVWDPCGHLPQLEYPDRCNRLIGDFTAHPAENR